MFYYLNNTFISNQNAQSIILNRGFKYGDGFFESILYENAEIQLWQYHWQRILDSIKILGFDNKDSFNSDSLLNILKDLINKNNFDTNTCRIRISFYREALGNYLPLNNQFNFFIEISPVTLAPNVPLRLCFYSQLKKQINFLSSLKSNNALIYCLSSIYAQQNNFDAALIYNENDEVIETNNSNIFIVENNKIVTPPLNSGCVNGVYRSYLIANYTVIERTISKHQILNAEYLFTSNAIKKIQLIKAIHNNNFKLEFDLDAHKKSH
jgi:branched-chain amino acid aminotransferase